MGVGGVARSLGLQDTIANVVSGFGFMLGKVIKPGDLVQIQGTTDIVKDINWRQTIIEERGGNHLVIPNALLNTSSFERITSLAEACVIVPFVAKKNIEPKEVEEKIIALVSEATSGMCMSGETPLVKFSGFFSTGVKGNVYLFASFE